MAIIAKLREYCVYCQKSKFKQGYIWGPIEKAVIAEVLPFVKDWQVKITVVPTVSDSLFVVALYWYIKSLPWKNVEMWSLILNRNHPLGLGYLR